MRGNHTSLFFHHGHLGPIPACAGQPQVRANPEKIHQADPRVCGATYSLSSTERMSKGRSPRVRGNPTKTRIDDLGVGPIPACAGQPACAASISSPLKADPRVCGATAVTLSIDHLVYGRSPRVRGNHDYAQVQHQMMGPIPACAGQPKADSPAN